MATDAPVAGPTGARISRADVPPVPTANLVDPAQLAPVRRPVSMARLARIGYVTSRRLGPVVLARPFVRDHDRRRRQLGTALAVAVSELGPTFVKLGQLLASSPSLAGETLANAMRGVLDDGPPVPFAEVRRIVEGDLGRTLEQVYSSFDQRPFAAASLAVVHRATLLDGTEVAVKVLRPSSARIVATDLSLVRPFVRRLAQLVPVGVVPAVPETVEGLAEQLSEELDLRNEAKVMDWFGAMVGVIGARGVRVPATMADASGRRVLTMEFIHGSKVDDLGAIAAGAIDVSAAIEALIESWFALTLCTGVFHGDMHAGNLLLTPAGEVVLLDWGIVGRLPAESQRFFRRSLEGALGDESAWPDVRDHMLATMPPDLLASVGITPDAFLELVRAQTLMIMTAPFSELNLMMLSPAAALPASEAPATPSSPMGWVRLIRDERKRVKAGGGASALMQQGAPRGEMLLIKQLIFFERYGKMFLGDQPLLYDTSVYTTLLALTSETADPSGTTGVDPSRTGSTDG